MIANLKRPIRLLLLFLAVLLGMKYLLPFFLPFLLGGGVALLAEPVVSLGVRRLKLPRPLAAGIGVSLTLLALVTLISFLGALAVRELGNLAGALPDIQETAQQGMILVQDWLVNITNRTPDGVRPLLQKTVVDFFGSGSALLEQVTGRIPGMVSGILSGVPNGALGFGTGLLASFMISARLPRLGQGIRNRLPPVWAQKYLPALRKVRQVMGGWLKAQGKLAGLTYVIVAAGFLLLRIPYGPVWAVLVALVDAIPILGTGTVLLPWALIKLLQAEHLQAIGLLCTYGVAFITRTALEPRLVGQHVGLDPLVTLVALYVGFRLWGVAGMLLAPILTGAVKSFLDATEPAP